MKATPLVWLVGFAFALVIGIGGTAPAARDLQADEEEPGVPAEFTETFGETDGPPVPWKGILLPFGAERRLRAFVEPLRKQRVEKAVDAALAWLAAHQCPEGHWSAQKFAHWCHGKPIHPGLSDVAYLDGIDPGVTGLAVLAFLGAGHEPWAPGPYEQTLSRAVVWLLQQQGEDGVISTHTSQSMISVHAYATWALVEAFGMTGQRQLGQYVQRAIEGLELARNPYFAWRYGIKPGDNDTATTGSCMMPFLAARRINEACVKRGLAKPLALDPEVLDGAAAWVDKMTDPDYGRTGYIQRGGASSRYQQGPSADECPTERFEGCTALGVLIRLATGADDEITRIKNEKAQKLLITAPVNWKNGQIDLYAWMYTALALQQLTHGASRYRQSGEDWYEKLVEVLVPAQRMDGDVCSAKGSWDPFGAWGWAGGRVYATAMAALALEAPIRYAPVKDEKKVLVQLAAEKDLSVAVRLRLLEAVAALEDQRSLRSVLSRLLKSKEPRLLEEALRLVPRLEKPPKSFRKRLVQLAQRGDPGVRVEALRTLAQFEAPVKERTALFQAALRDPDVWVFWGAIVVLRGAEPIARELWAEVEGLLEHPEVVRSALAASVLYVHEPTHKRAAALLRKQIRSRDPDVVVALKASIGWSVPEWAKVSDAQIEYALEHDLPVAFRGPIGTRFVLIPPGTFRMGSPEDEKERLPDETLHEVTITRPFFLQIAEVTNEAYRRKVSEHKTHGFEGTVLDMSVQPVLRVGHVDAVEFATWLSGRSRRWTFRLPTEAEWEYAARAGTSTRFWWGEDEEKACTCDDVADEAARDEWKDGFGQFVESTPQWRWFEGYDGHVGTGRADSRKPNPWGLHAMHGNAAEWCADWKGDYPAGPVTDPTGARSGAMRVYRGGSWVGSPQQCRAAMRGLLPGHLQPGAPCVWIGFRLVATPK